MRELVYRQNQKRTGGKEMKVKTKIRLIVATGWGLTTLGFLFIFIGDGLYTVRQTGEFLIFFTFWNCLGATVFFVFPYLNFDEK